MEEKKKKKKVFHISLGTPFLVIQSSQSLNLLSKIEYGPPYTVDYLCPFDSEEVDETSHF